MSETFEKRIRHLVSPVYRQCDVRICFTKQRMFNMSQKDRLPAQQNSNVIYLFKCWCGHQYVGKTTQRLEKRIKQHLPSVLTSRTRPCKESDSAIGQHLALNASCLDHFSWNMFSIVCKARTESILHVLESLYISKIKPQLCKQMSLVKTLQLFPGV